MPGTTPTGRRLERIAGYCAAVHEATVSPAGEYLRDELEERGWTVTELAEIIGRPVQAVSEILNGRKEITTNTACALA